MQRLVMLLPILFIFSCSDIVGIEEEKGSSVTDIEVTKRGVTKVVGTQIYGYMYNARWSRMTNATIRAKVNGRVVAETKSNANGYYSLLVNHTGSVVIEASKSGYKTLALTHKPGNAVKYRYNMHLRTDAYHANVKTRVYGYLKDAPIAGIKMAVLDINGRIIQTGVTTSKGAYSMNIVHNGTFCVTTNDPRYPMFYNVHSFETSSLRFDIVTDRFKEQSLKAYDKNDHEYQGLVWYTQSKKTATIKYGAIYEETEFDPQKPTVLFVHGWCDPRDKYYHGSFKYADEYLARGYNVGMYRWHKRSNIEYGGFGAGASTHNVGSLVHGVNKPGGTADKFIEEFKRVLTNGVAMKRKRTFVKGKSYYEELSKSSLAAYDKEIRLIGHSTGGQIVSQAGNDNYLMSKKIMLVLLDPFFPASNAANYRLKDFQEGIKNAGQTHNKPVYFVMSSFIGCEGYRRLRDQDVNNFHKYIVRSYVRTDAPRYGTRIASAPKRKNRREECETAYVYSDATQPGNSEVAHNYSIDWYCETFEHNRRPKAWYWDRNRVIQYAKYTSASGATGYGTFLRDKGYCYQQLINQPYTIHIDGGQYTWNISDDKFIEMNSRKFHPWNPNSNAILAQKF